MGKVNRNNNGKNDLIWLTIGVVGCVLVGVAGLVWKYRMQYIEAVDKPDMNPVVVAYVLGLTLLFVYGLAVGIGRFWSYIQLLRFPNKKRRNRHLRWIIMQWVGVPVLVVYMLFLMWMVAL
jgi:lipoprotein|nr:MAG TPA: hypothetical protein [Caudoviricetes sp.]